MVFSTDGAHRPPTENQDSDERQTDEFAEYIHALADGQAKSDIWTGEPLLDPDAYRVVAFEVLLKAWENATTDQRDLLFSMLLRAFEHRRGAGSMQDVARSIGAHPSTVWRWQNCKTRANRQMQKRVISWMKRRA